MPGQCRHCLLRRDVHGVSRQGGGTYRRGGPSYRSSLCGECAISLLRHANGRRDISVARFDVRGVERIVGALGTPEAAEILDFHRQQHANHKAIREAASS